MIDKPGLSWQSLEHRQREWQVANDMLRNDVGALKPSGTKLSRKMSGLSHSYMIFNHQICALSRSFECKILGRGSAGYVKCSEKESGEILIIKIMPFLYLDEAEIAHDLGLAGRYAIRGHIKKLYIPYQYLGLTLKYLPHLQNIQEALDLCVRISMKFHALHEGRMSRTRKGYLHRDVHFGNIVVDELSQPHLIDYGFSVLNGPHLENEKIQECFQVMRLFYDDTKSQSILFPFFIKYDVVFHQNHCPEDNLCYVWICAKHVGAWQYCLKDSNEKIIIGELNYAEIRDKIAEKMNFLVEISEIDKILEDVESTEELQKKMLFLQSQYAFQLSEIIRALLVEKGVLYPQISYMQPLYQLMNRKYDEFQQGIHQLIDIAFVFMITRMKLDYRDWIFFFQAFGLHQKERFIFDMQEYLLENRSSQDIEMVLSARMLRI